MTVPEIIATCAGLTINGANIIHVSDLDDGWSTPRILYEYDYTVDLYPRADSDVMPLEFAHGHLVRFDLMVDETNTGRCCTDIETWVVRHIRLGVDLNADERVGAEDLAICFAYWGNTWMGRPMDEAALSDILAHWTSE